MKYSSYLSNVHSFIVHLFVATIVGVFLGCALFVVVDLTENVTVEVQERNREHLSIRYFYDIAEARDSCRDHLFGTILNYNGHEEVYICTTLDTEPEPVG